MHVLLSNEQGVCDNALERDLHTSVFVFPLLVPLDGNGIALDLLWGVVGSIYLEFRDVRNGEASRIEEEPEPFLQNGLLEFGIKAEAVSKVVLGGKIGIYLCGRGGPVGFPELGLDADDLTRILLDLNVSEGLIHIIPRGGLRSGSCHCSKLERAISTLLCGRLLLKTDEPR